jgi:hypothetical protein
VQPTEGETAAPLADQNPAAQAHCASAVAPAADTEPAGHATGALAAPPGQ